jgi:hypothetical protein
MSTASSPLSPAVLRKSRLQTESYLLARRYGSVAYDQQDGSWLHIAKFPVPHGWNKSFVEILIDIPWGVPGYPSIAPKWFWTDRDLQTRDGRDIGHFFAAAGSGQVDKLYLDKDWGHFCVYLRSWRPSSGNAIQTGHNLLTYLALIDTVFHDRATLEGRRYGA